MAADCGAEGVLCVGPGKRFTTIQAAADAAEPGDLVQVGDGTWAGFRVTTSGSSAAPITFLATGSHVVINSLSPRSVTQDLIEVADCKWVVIDGFTLTGAPRAGISVIHARDVVVRNNIVGPSYRWGIFSGFSPNILVLNNKTFGSATEHGIYLSNSDEPHDHYVVRGNESYRNASNGIQLNGDCKTLGKKQTSDGKIEDAIVENNVVHDNGQKGLSIISAPGVIIRTNVVYNNAIKGAAGGIHLTDEGDCAAPSKDAVVVGNTVVEPRTTGIRATDGATGMIVFNNVVISRRPVIDDAGGGVVDRRSNITGDDAGPVLANPESGNFHLRTHSPAIGVAMLGFAEQDAPADDLEGNHRRFGGTSASGAYEYTAIPPVDSTAPTKPANLAAKSATARRVELIWSPSMDPYSMTNQASGVVGYYVYRDQVKLGFTSLASFADSGVEPGAEYTYTVFAADRIGNRSAASEALKVKTPAGAVRSAPVHH